MVGGVCSTCFPYANLSFHYCGWNRLAVEKNTVSLSFYYLYKLCCKKKEVVKVGIKEMYVVYRVPTIPVS
jgi:hypothetical protein